MDWEVRVKANSKEAVYTLAAPRYYDARKKGVELFLKENKIPGSPWEYFTTKKGLVEASVRSLRDRRREIPEKEFYVEQVEYLRKLLRESKLDSDVREKGTKLLIQLRKVLGE